MLLQDDLYIAARAASIAGIDPTAWLTDAIRSKARKEESACRNTSRLLSGPWPHWMTEEFESGWLLHHGPNGMEISFIPRRLPHWSGTLLRPWTARTVDTVLRTRTGRIRAFESQDAAKLALDKFNEDEVH